MADEFKDVIRLEAATDEDITGGTPIAVKLKQFAHALSSGNLYYKNSLGAFVLFKPASIYASQAGGNGSVLIGDSGINGVTPEGGTVSGSGTVHAMMVGLKDYADSLVPSSVLAGLFPFWDAEEPYSQNDIVAYTSVGGAKLAISNIAGDGTNTGNNPEDAGIYWTLYEADYPLAQVITMILNTKANA